MKCRTGQGRHQSPGCVSSCTNPRAHCTDAPGTEVVTVSRPSSTCQTPVCQTHTRETICSSCTRSMYLSYIIINPVLKYTGIRTQERNKSKRLTCKKERKGTKGFKQVTFSWLEGNWSFRRQQGRVGCSLSSKVSEDRRNSTRAGQDGESGVKAGTGLKCQSNWFCFYLMINIFCAERFKSKDKIWSSLYLRNYVIRYSRENFNCKGEKIKISY